MKKSNFYLLFSLSMLFLMGSCSNTSKMSRINTGKLQYAQSAPHSQQEMAKADVNASPAAVAGTEQHTANSPLLKNSKPASSSRPVALKLAEKKAAKTIAKVQEKVANTKLSKKVTASAQAPQLEHRLTVAIVLIVVGLILSYFAFIPFGLIGVILGLIGLIILLVWLLDAL